MKTSYTKRALAFWLAVAMLATGAPAALAREPDTGTGGSTSVSGTTTTPTTPGETTETSGEPDTPQGTTELNANDQTLNDLSVGTAFTSGSAIVSGGQGGYKMTAKDGTIPSWLSLTDDGKLSGTPTEVGSGNVTVTISDSTAGTPLTKDIRISYTVKAKEIAVTAATVADKTYDRTTTATVTSVTFGSDSLDPGDYTATAKFTSADASESAQATVTVELTEQGKQKYSLKDSTCSTTGKITKADVNAITPAKQSVQLNTSINTIKEKLAKTTVTGVNGETVTGTFEITGVTSNGPLPTANALADTSIDSFTQTSGNYTVTATFTPTGANATNYNAKTDITFSCDVTGQSSQTLSFTKESITATFGETVGANTATSTAKNDSGKITYESTNTSVATVDKDTGSVTIVGAGTTTIKAHTDGSDQYLPADASYTLTVNPKNVSDAAIEDITQQTYTGNEIEPELTIQDGKTMLEKGKDYDVAYTNNVFPGTATATVTFKGNYSGTATKTFVIQAGTYNNTSISQSVVAGQDAVLTIPVDLANAEITSYGTITVDGMNASIVDGTPTRNENAITAKIKSSATNNQTANIKIKLTTKGYGEVELTYILTVAGSKTQLTSSQINFVSKTVTADGKTYFKLDNASLKDVTDTKGKWTYALKGVSTLSEQSEMPSFKDAGVYTIVASYQGDKYVGSKEATLTIKPAVKSTITVSASQLGSSYDDNHKYWDLDKRGSGDGYLNLRADADDYLVNQRINGRSSEWIGMTISPEVSGTAKASGLWVSTNQSTWYELKKNDTLSLSDFYIRDIGDKTFDLWYDTDDRDCHDSLYLATDSKGSNKFEIYVDFNSYSGSSSSSSGSSSSDTSKKDGDRVSTTTIDKTPSVKSRSATVTFSSSAMSDALDENKREARHEDADVTYIELDARTSKTVDDTTITVPRKSLDNIADEDTGLILTTNHGTFTFDDRALAEIYDTCDKTNIDFYIEEEDDDQYIVLIKDGSDDVIDLGSGEVEIVFDYRLKSGEKSSDVNVYRIGDGDKEFDYARNMKADYSSSKKEATFTTDTLGTFLVTTDTLKTGSDSSTTTTPPTTPAYSRFVDVPSSRWSATYINKLASLGIINGTGGGYFEPTLQVTREEFVKMLAGVAGANVSGYTSSRFPDVPMSRWSASYIAWAADRGITTGTDGGRFAPTMKITREEMATMIYRYVQISGKTLPAKNAPVTFADADQISSWAQTAVSVMQQAGIIDGNVTNGRYTFDPKVPASREECAKMLSILYDLL